MARARYFGRHRFGAAGLVWCMAGAGAARSSHRRGLFRRFARPAARPGAQIIVLPVGHSGGHRGTGVSHAA